MTDDEGSLTEDVWICRVCHRPLDVYEERNPIGDLSEFKMFHTAFDVANGVRHEPDPVRLKDVPGQEVVGVCDFCTAPSPTWLYDCKNFNSTVIGFKEETGEQVSSGSIGAWAACDACHRLIGFGNWDKLTRNAVANHSPAHRHALRAALRHLYKEFDANRIGEPYRIG